MEIRGGEVAMLYSPIGEGLFKNGQPQIIKYRGNDER